MMLIHGTESTVHERESESKTGWLSVPDVSSFPHRPMDGDTVNIPQPMADNAS